MSKPLLIGLCLLLATATYGQEKPKAPFFSGVDLMFDYGKLVGLIVDYESKFEGGAGLVFADRLRLVGEYGQAELTPERAFRNVLNFAVEGTYIRFGADYLIPLQNDQHTFYIGVRYALSTFDDRGEVQILSDVHNDFVETFNRQDQDADWIELVLGTKTEVRPNLYLGLRFRYRRLGQFDNNNSIPVYAIPGYGRTADSSVPAGNLYIQYRLATRRN